jgi:alginate O-acetyltransferase complex protein AlgJ
MKTVSNLSSPRRLRLLDWLLIVVFSTLLALPTLDYFTGVDVTRPPDENRLPTPKPHLARWNLPGMESYLSGAEAYFNDHFGFRKRLIRWCQQWKSRLYRDESGHKVIVGQHGWLFTGELEMIEHYLGMAKFTPQQLHDWQTLLEKRRDWLAARGIKYLFVVAPDKHDIYPEELPAWLQSAARADRETKLDQFLAYMQAHSTVEVLDLRPALRAAKTTAPTYLQLDSHWNFFGGFIAGQQVIQALRQQFPDLPPLRLEDFDWTNVPEATGDLSRLMGKQMAEHNFYVFKTKPGLIAPEVRLATNIVSAWDAHKQSYISETAAPLTVNAVIFHDSFAIPWRQFFGQSFKRIVFMSEHREFNTKVIEQNHPQVVVNEILERFFNTFDPNEIMAKDGLP